MKNRILTFFAAAAAAFLAAACSLLPPAAPIERAPIEGPDDYVPEATRSIATLQRDTGGTVRYDGMDWVPRADRINVLLIGVDKDATRNETGRSDMLILCSMDPQDGSVSMLTIPRDTRAYVYQVGENGEIAGEQYEKINHAYAYGGGPDRYSAENTMACVSRLLSCGGLLSVPVHNYVSIDLDGLADLADVFGGVEVTFDQTIPGVGQKGETVNLQGPFVRYYLERRHDQLEGEVSRQKHQQTFMKELLRKIKEEGAAAHAPELYSALTQFVRTNLSLGQCLELAGIIDGISVDDIQVSRIVGEGVTEDGVWYLAPDNEQMTRAVLESQYVPKNAG